MTNKEKEKTIEEDETKEESQESDYPKSLEGFGEEQIKSISFIKNKRK